MNRRIITILGSFFLVAGGSLCAFPGSRNPAGAPGGVSAVFERRYILPNAQAELLSLLLRLDLPPDTTVRAVPTAGTARTAVFICGPADVHEAVAPFARLLATRRTNTGVAERSKREQDAAMWEARRAD